MSIVVLVANAFAAAVLVLPISVRRECRDIAGDDFRCCGGV